MERPSNTRNETVQRIYIEHPTFIKYSIIPRHSSYVEDLVKCWRDCYSSRGCIYDLRLGKTV
jgi:hypothetical protein